jgi:DNA-binding transcriptional LysR family regulator
MQNTHDRNFDIRQLEAFAAVMSAGSITGGARLLGRSQSAVTRLIQELEADLGFQLLHRSGPRVTPTDQGVRFHEEVEQMMSGLRRLREQARNIVAHEARAIQIVATAALAAGIVPGALARLSRTHLPNRVMIRTLSPEQVVQSVQARSADIGLSSLPIDHPGLTVHWTVEAPCVAVLAANHPLAQEPSLHLHHLTGQTLVTVENPYRLRGRIDQALAEAGVEPRAVIETNVALNAVLAARAGLGIALIEPATAYGVPIADVVVKPLTVKIQSPWGLITPLTQPPTPDITALIHALKHAATTILPGCLVLGGEGGK